MSARYRAAPRTLPERGPGRPIAFLFALAPDGACQAAVLPRRWWSLTPPFQLFPLRLAAQVGVFFSAALSVGSLRPLEPGLSSRVLQTAHRATVWPTQQCKSVAHRCRRQWHNTSVRHDKPRTTPCSTIGLSMGNVVSRDATALRTPPSTRCVPASSPRRDVGIFSFTDNPIACGQPG